MKLTKYNHACLTLEKDGQMLVVDPGNFSTDFIPPENIVAGIVVTHAHADHADHDMIAAIVDKNPDAVIVGPEEAVSTIEVFQTKAVKAGDTLTIGPFDLEFFGGTHAAIHRTLPVAANLGVMVDGLFYYPGDSFTLPGKPVDTLAVPAGGPWLKIGDAMDFLEQVKPRFAFPTHDTVLSDSGKFFADRQLGSIAEKDDIEYKRLESPIEI